MATENLEINLGVKANNFKRDLDKVQDEINQLVDGFDGMPNTTWIITNTYTTGDFGYAEGKDEIPGFPNFFYSGMAADLWTAPYSENFKIKDTGFAGKSSSGDPRWRLGL